MVEVREPQDDAALLVQQWTDDGLIGEKQAETVAPTRSGERLLEYILKAMREEKYALVLANLLLGIDTENVSPQIVNAIRRKCILAIGRDLLGLSDSYLQKTYRLKRKEIEVIMLEEKVRKQLERYI